MNIRWPMACSLALVLAGLLRMLSPGPAALAGEPGPDQPTPPKVDSPEAAATLLKGLAGDMGQAEAGKLDFAQSKALFSKLDPARPFLTSLQKHDRPAALLGVASVSLFAGEPEAAIEAFSALFDDKDVKLDEKARAVLASQCYFAAVLADKSDLARKMLSQMDLALAKHIGKDSDLIGRKLPPFRLELMDGRTLRVGGTDDRVLVLSTWAVFNDDAHKKLLGPLRELERKYVARPGFAMVGVNLNYAAERAKVAQCIRGENLRWPHVFEGKGLESAVCKSLGIVGWVGVLVIGPDNRVLCKGGPADNPTTWAIHYGLRQIEKKQPAEKNPPTPGRPPTTQPTGPATPSSTPRPPTLPADPAEQAFNLAETYRAAGLADRARELLEQLIREHPNSPHAAKARALLNE